MKNFRGKQCIRPNTKQAQKSVMNKCITKWMPFVFKNKPFLEHGNLHSAMDSYFIVSLDKLFEHVYKRSCKHVFHIKFKTYLYTSM